VTRDATLHTDLSATLLRDLDGLRGFQRLILLLDYDGTLVPFAPLPGLAVPDPELVELLSRLSRRPRTQVHLVSGRPRSFLESWFGELGLGLHAEHGFWSRRMPGETWVSRAPRFQDWKPEVVRLLSNLSTSTPGSFIEEKTASIAWHYRRTPPDLARVSLRRAREMLGALCQRFEIDLIDGSMVLEVRPCGFNKGSAVHYALADEAGAGVFAAGDDVTDEDLFLALPRDAVSVAVGERAQGALHRVPSHLEVRALLQRLVH
jgi:trehalose 6-phosphate synthase/phosphatase